MKSVPKDKTLYNSVKKKLFSKMPKNSAYRSALLIKQYKAAYKKKHKSDKAYIGKKNEKKGIARWMKEDWRTQDGKKTYSKKSDVFRPTKKITKKTPKTYKELGGEKSERIKKAQREKAKTGRVKRY